MSHIDHTKNAVLASDKNSLEEIGRRLARIRLNQNLTQEEICHAADISRRTLSRLENGNNVDVISFLGVLKALGLISHFIDLVPLEDVSPIQLVDTQDKSRQRASRNTKATSKRAKAVKEWQWPEQE